MTAMALATLGFSLTAPDAPARSGTVNLTYSAAGGPGRLELSGSGTYAVDLAMMPAAGLRGLLVIFDAFDASDTAVTTPVTLTWTSNSVSKSEELSPGGAFLLASPSPTHGITALSIVHTAAAVVRVHVLG